jgi:tetratricopeptide (TPR) repeat protein
MLKINQFVTWVLLAVIVFSTLLLYSPGLLKALSENLATSRDIKSSTLKINPEACFGNSLTYPKFALCIEKLLNQNDAESADRLYPEYIKTGHTGTIFSPYYLAQIEDYRSNYQSACHLLQKINSKPTLLIMADKAYSTNNWNGLATYLDCINQVKASLGYVNPYRTAVLFNNLGMHLEEIKNYTEAERAYSLAGDWYPTVWSEPFIHIARIKSERNDNEGAKNILLSAYQKATLPQSKFLLMREFGVYSEMTSNYGDALCAYQAALKLSEGLPANYAPQTMLGDLNARINKLISQFGKISCDNNVQ